MPPAPALFSTTMVHPVDFCSSCATSRETAVGASARRERHDQANGLRRIVLGGNGRGDGKGGERRDDEANHDVPLFKVDFPPGRPREACSPSGAANAVSVGVVI